MGALFKVTGVEGGEGLETRRVRLGVAKRACGCGGDGMSVSASERAAEWSASDKTVSDVCPNLILESPTRLGIPHHPYGSKR